MVRVSRILHKNKGFICLSERALLPQWPTNASDAEQHNPLAGRGTETQQATVMKQKQNDKMTPLSTHVSMSRFSFPFFCPLCQGMQTENTLRCLVHAENKKYISMQGWGCVGGPRLFPNTDMPDIHPGYTDNKILVVDDCHQTSFKLQHDNLGNIGYNRLYIQTSQHWHHKVQALWPISPVPAATLLYMVKAAALTIASSMTK